jgi:O-antigen ligase
LSWHDLMQHAWIGYGPGYRLNSPPGEQFPHNLFLSTWLYTGLVGLVLLLIYLLKVLQSALSSPVKADRATNIAILLLLVVSAMTEFSQLIKGPGPMWYIFWLPTLLALSNGFCSHGCKCAPECESQLLL